MRYADIIYNDIVAGDGLCVSFLYTGVSAPMQRMS